MKNIFGKAILLATALLFSITGTSCSNDDNTTPEKEKTYDMSGFAKGADVSWITEMEQDGVKFYNHERQGYRMHEAPSRRGNQFYPSACLGKSGRWLVWQG